MVLRILREFCAVKMFMKAEMCVVVGKNDDFNDDQLENLLQLTSRTSCRLVLN